LVPRKSLIKQLSKAVSIATLITITITSAITFSTFILGCGDETTTDTTASTTPVIQPVKVNHIGPLAIEVLDNRSDVISSNEHELTSAPQFMDINSVNISKDVDKL
jgi:hypothetical protein